MPGSGTTAADDTSRLRRTARPGHCHRSVSARSARPDRPVRVPIPSDSDRAEVSSRAHHGRSGGSPSAITVPDDGARTVRAGVQLYLAGGRAFAAAWSGEVVRHDHTDV
jgi:hypothetical protein